MTDNIIYRAAVEMERQIDSDYSERLKAHLSNWIKVSDIIYSECTTEYMVLALLGYEIKNRQRPYVITRMHARYSYLRLKREKREVTECLERLGLKLD